MNEVDVRNEDKSFLCLKLPSLVVSDHSDLPEQGHVTSWLLGHEPYFKNGLTVCDLSHCSILERSESCSSLSTYALSDGSPDIESKKECDYLSVKRTDGRKCFAADFIPDSEEDGRKVSNCSTCSATSTPEFDEPSNRMGSGWKKVRSVVSWSPFIQTYKKQRYPWIQLAGHQGSFKAADERGTILKRLCPREERCFNVLMMDSLRPFVPECKGQVITENGERYLALEDLLCQFSSPCVMDCKIGSRTYLEEELTRAQEKTKLRRDLYEKMISTDPAAPTEDERREQGVSKQRYMLWRETVSSSSSLGFRIEGVRHSEGASTREFRTMRTKESIKEAFQKFTGCNPTVIEKYLHRMAFIREALLMSDFFSSHEVIGSSLLFIHDVDDASVWLIDFAKTIPLPSGVHSTHSCDWMPGNHEDGYLIGLDNIISIFNDVLSEL